jgi:hypothetical protein
VSLQLNVFLGYFGIFRPGDSTKLKVEESTDMQNRFLGTYSSPFTMPRKHIPYWLLEKRFTTSRSQSVPIEGTYTYEVENKTYKYVSREHSHLLGLTSPVSPWSLSIQRSLRKNLIDKDASRQFLLHESLPSMKYSSTLAYQVMSGSTWTRFSTELALPLLASNEKCAAFARFNLHHA